MNPDFIFHRERPVSDVPALIRLCLLLALCLQLVWHGLQPPLEARAKDLPPPLPVRAYIMASLGEPVAAGRYLDLWLQAFDDQPGVSLSFNQLDYHRLTQWLDVILELDPRGQYPLLLAARVYGSIRNPEKQRVMMEYIYTRFNQDPDRYWRWLAHAVITAKHELRDPALALKYADALASRGSKVPYWARDMKIIVLEDMGRLEAARILTGALIDSGEISDPYELKFLTNKITELEKKSLKKRQTVEK